MPVVVPATAGTSAVALAPVAGFAELASGLVVAGMSDSGILAFVVVDGDASRVRKAEQPEQKSKDRRCCSKSWRTDQPMGTSRAVVDIAQMIDASQRVPKVAGSSQNSYGHKLRVVVGLSIDFDIELLAARHMLTFDCQAEDKEIGS